MIRSLLLGSLLGLFSGLVPGPYSAVVVATALDRGARAALPVALMPLATESVVMLATVLLLSQVPEGALRWMGLGGAALVLYLAWRTWRAAEGGEEGQEGSARRRTAQAALLELLSPAPWMFWLLLGSPLLLSAYRSGLLEAGLFLGSFLAFLVGVHLTVAWLSARGGRLLGDRWRGRVLRGASVTLALAGGVLAWQAWVGNFRELVRGPERVREIVDEAAAPLPGGGLVPAAQAPLRMNASRNPLTTVIQMNT